MQQVCRALPHGCVLLLELARVFCYYTIRYQGLLSARLQNVFGASFGENPMIDHLPSQAQDKQTGTIQELNVQVAVLTVGSFYGAGWDVPSTEEGP